jgi:hypothetical protein
VGTAVWNWLGSRFSEIPQINSQKILQVEKTLPGVSV